MKTWQSERLINPRPTIPFHNTQRSLLKSILFSSLPSESCMLYYVLMSVVSGGFACLTQDCCFYSLIICQIYLILQGVISYFVTVVGSISVPGSCFNNIPFCFPFTCFLLIWFSLHFSFMNSWKLWTFLLSLAAILFHFL